MINIISYISLAYICLPVYSLLQFCKRNHNLKNNEILRAQSGRNFRQPSFMFSSMSSPMPLLAASSTVNYFTLLSLLPFVSRLLSSLVYLVNISFAHLFIKPGFIEPLLCTCKGLISGLHGHGRLQHTTPYHQESTALIISHLVH